MLFVERDIAIDLGTTSTLLYVRGKGVSMREPTVVAVDKISGKLLKVGEDAEKMLGRTPANIVAIHPIAGGVISVGTLVAVFLSTSDELIPVFISKQVPVALMVKIVAVKVVAAIAVGFSINAILSCLRHIRRRVEVHDLCAHSRCGCREHRGILVPALIHTIEIFVFIAVVSGLIELAMHYFGENCLESLRLNAPVFGELAAGLLGLIPNCAVSVAGAELYCQGAMSAGALMASSFTGSGLGLLVLFRTNRNLGENLAILASVYVVGVALGIATGRLI